MALIIETGVGVRNANAYVNSAYVTSYLTARNRVTENGWDTRVDEVKEAAIIAATDYIDMKFGSRFQGQPKVFFEPTFAEAEVLFSGLPDPADELTLGDDIYVFVASLSGVPFEVLIGASATATASNLEAAINGTAGAGITYGSETPQSRHGTAKASGAVLTLTATAPGTSGALSVLQGPVTNVTITGFTGGKDGGIQPLSWPRSNAYDARGHEIFGIPEKLKQAVAEYAVRAIASTLLPDPTMDVYGGRVNRRTETVGPITESFSYDIGTMGTITFTSYPAADRLLRSLLLGSGNRGVIRG